MTKYHYSVRITTPTARGPNVSRQVMQVASAEALVERLVTEDTMHSKIETQCIGEGAPTFIARSKLHRAFHTEQQRATYEAGLDGRGVYPLDQGPLDNFNYMGEQDAELLWDATCTEGDGK